MTLVCLKPLKDICIEHITKNFELLMIDCYSGKSKIPNIHFEFLQRKFSEFFLETLDKDIVSKFWQFLVNRHLKKLDVANVHCISISELNDRLKVCGESIEMLSLNNQTFSEKKLIEMFYSLPNVQELYLSATNTTNKVLESIGKNCRFVRVLNINSCKVTAKGLQHLCERENNRLMQNTRLEKLYMNSTTNSDIAVVFALKYFPSLTIFEHKFVAEVIYEAHESQFREGVIEDLPMYNLTTLEVSELSDESYQIANVLKVCSAVCPNVTSLTVENVSTQAEVAACCDFKCLTSVSLSAPSFGPLSDIELLVVSAPTDLRDIDYSDLLTCKGEFLVKLELHTGIVSIEALCKFCPNLESLLLEDIAFEDFSDMLTLDTVAFPKMKSIVFQKLFFDEQTCESTIFMLHSSPQLERLGFPFSRFFDDRFVVALQRCQCVETLKKLDFSFSNLKLFLAKKFLSTLPKLEKMVVDGCHISKQHHESLVELLGAENRSVDIVYANEDSSSDSDSEFSADFDSEGSDYGFHMME